MDQVLLLETVRQLDAVGPGPLSNARPQAVRQFNGLLADAKALYSQRIDIQALEEFPHTTIVSGPELADAVQRLKLALELRPVSSIATLLEEIHLPENLSEPVIRDFAELREAAAFGLAKTVLLLAGLVAESLLLTRHPDHSERGPGLGVLVKQAREQRLFGRDTLRHLDNLIDYRDLIHPRSEVRNRIEPNQARVESALTAIKLLCSELEHDDARYA